ncbi:hypothetical protein NV379_06985 [Paenibacillus sp. N1-5-1-14]|uniref:hypothetical protein n=1 Tax=Paenibacillus radicibacter TaxID=2972488 RepID=UPI0021591BB2|nr:hypothetical protein [Paenibacillus radicibacter]MCR8642404.1 hypothetical protein [Paenibacillus radicibacter]
MSMQKSDMIIVILLVTICVAWITLRMRSWLETPKGKLMIPISDEIPQDEAVELLEGAGFDVVAAKTRIPIMIELSDMDEPMQSRLFVDYFVKKEDQYYLVKLARDRKPIDWTGSALRDALLPYQLLYPEAAGILYVDMYQQKIKKIKFQIEVQL